MGAPIDETIQLITEKLSGQQHDSRVLNGHYTYPRQGLLFLTAVLHVFRLLNVRRLFNGHFVSETPWFVFFLIIGFVPCQHSFR